MTKKQTRWENVKLKASLFRIWFMKNILVFLQVIGLIILILLLTGVLPTGLPIIGVIFDELVFEIRNIINYDNHTGILHFFAVGLSTLLTIGIFTVKARSIAISDIKNPKLKLALIKANLYFNQNGKLTKKVEKITNTDINGDGKVDESEPTINTGFFKGIKNCVSEFVTIMKADMESDEKTNTEVYNETLKDANLVDAAEGIVEMSNIVEEGTLTYSEDKLEAEADKRKEEIDQEDIPDEEKEVKKNIVSRALTSLKQKIAAHKADSKAKKEERLARLAEIKETKEKAKQEESIEKPETTTETKPVVSESRPMKSAIKESKQDRAVNDFLRKLRG